MAKINEFDGLDFVPGKVRGARTFRVDSLGRLTGVNYQQVWTPGENLAVCKAPGDGWSSWGGYVAGPGPIVPQYGTSGWSGSAVPYVTVGPPGMSPDEMAYREKEARRQHNMARCKCGMYAYYDGSNDYATSGHVSGVIEGWGETLIGSRGFRTSKARIVALVVDGQPFDYEESPRRPSPLILDRVRHNYAEIPFFDSFDRMLDEFPCEGAPVYTPETDPEFWTRPL